MNFVNKNLKKTNTLFTIFGEGFEKSTKCILCDKNLKKNRSYVRFVGKDLKNMYQVAQKFSLNSLNVTGTM